MKQMLSIAAAVFLSFNSLGQTYSPFSEWKTIETDHFLLNYPAELKEVADLSAAYLEEAHRLLSPWLRWEPRSKVEVTLIDTSDAANGAATAQARLGIQLRAASPESWGTLYTYDNWLRLLILHEYTHVLNIDPTLGLWEVGRLVFGDTVRPNALWPRWMTEGIAVWVESHYTDGGRGRSTRTQALLRAAIEEDVLDTKDFMTLDKLSGSPPYYPAGDSPYFFGYQLFQEVATDPPNLERIAKTHNTFDGQDAVVDVEDYFGVMSYRSSRRVPYLIDLNLENITGKSWHVYWDQWVRRVTKEKKAELKKIARAPITPHKAITRDGLEAKGTAVSPDGRYLAISRRALNEVSGLYLKDLKTKETKRVLRKAFGVGLGFSPDSKHLFFSSFRRQKTFNNHSDIGIYHLETDSVTWITDNARAKDPHISKNGKWVAYSFNEPGKSSVAISPILYQDGEWSLGKRRIIHQAKILESAAHPKFHPNGRQIAYAVHPRGKNQEDIVTFDLKTGSKRIIVSDGHYNRFPTYDSKGRLYYISDKGGVDNLYLFREGGKSIRLTNVTTAIILPEIHATGRTFFASRLSYKGWDIVELPLGIPREPLEEIQIAKVEYPVKSPRSESKLKIKSETEEDYSAWDSILPRQWRPLAGHSSSLGFNIGAKLSGNDTLEYHFYSLGLRYYAGVSDFSFGAGYSNRLLGPTLGFTGDYSIISSGTTSSGVVVYTKEADVSATLSYPFRMTFKTFTPSISGGFQRQFGFAPDLFDSSFDSTEWVGNVAVRATYSDTRSSPLAISSEKGRNAEVGIKTYFPNDGPVVKGLVEYREFLELWKHTVFTPHAAFAWSSKTSSFSNANAQVLGSSYDIFEDVGTRLSQSLDSLEVRGYPGLSVRTKLAGVASIDYRFPIWRINRGWGTAPIYLRNLFAFTFIDTAIFPEGDPGDVFLPSAGTGLVLTSRILANAEISLSLQFHQGILSNRGGDSEFIVSLSGFSLSL